MIRIRKPSSSNKETGIQNPTLSWISFPWAISVIALVPCTYFKSHRQVIFFLWKLIINFLSMDKNLSVMCSH